MKLKIETPDDFNFEQCLRFLNRHPLECTHHVGPNSAKKLLPTDQGPVLLSITAEKGNLDIETRPEQFDQPATQQIKDFVTDWFDLSTDLTDFYRQVEKDPVLAAPIKQFRGLRLIGIPDLFEALGWAIIGQQINLTFAYQLKKRLVEAFGDSFTSEGQEYYLFPSPEFVAALNPDLFRKMQFSNGKATYLINLAQAMVEGKLSKGDLMGQDMDKVADHLCQIKGIGPWSAHYAIMKCLRYPHAFPIADVGLHNAIKKQLRWGSKPTIGQVREMAVNWKGWEAYATFYLWHSLIKD